MADSPSYDIGFALPGPPHIPMEVVSHGQNIVDDVKAEVIERIANEVVSGDAKLAKLRRRLKSAINQTISDGKDAIALVQGKLESAVDSAIVEGKVTLGLLPNGQDPVNAVPPDLVVNWPDTISPAPSSALPPSQQCYTPSWLPPPDPTQCSLTRYTTFAIYYPLNSDKPVCEFIDGPFCGPSGLNILRTQLQLQGAKVVDVFNYPMCQKGFWDTVVKPAICKKYPICCDATADPPLPIGDDTPEPCPPGCDSTGGDDSCCPVNPASGDRQKADDCPPCFPCPDIDRKDIRWVGIVSYGNHQGDEAFTGSDCGVRQFNEDIARLMPYKTAREILVDKEKIEDVALLEELDMPEGILDEYVKPWPRCGPEEPIPPRECDLMRIPGGEK